MRTRWLLGAASIALFLVALGVLSGATETLALDFREQMPRFVRGGFNALGVGWLATYLVLNGSVVAAIAVALHQSALIDPYQLFLMLAGSRLGSAAFVMLVGVIDHLQRRERRLRDALALGLVVFLVTHAIYLPATVIGYLAWPAMEPLFGVFEAADLDLPTLELTRPVFTAVAVRLGPGIAFLAAIGLLFASVRLLDRLLRTVDMERFRARYLARLTNKWISFALGFVITVLSASVAFSVGILVPLYSRKQVHLREVVPYVLGANLGTLADTGLVAVLLDSPTGLAVVTLLVGAAAVVTLPCLWLQDSYVDLVDRGFRGINASRRRLALFLGVLVAVPLLLAFV